MSVAAQENTIAQVKPRVYRGIWQIGPVSVLQAMERYLLATPRPDIACLKNPDAFFVTGAAQRQVARSCNGCPLLQECRVVALLGSNEHGVRGGLTERERRQIRKDPARLNDAFVACLAALITSHPGFVRKVGRPRPQVPTPR